MAYFLARKQSFYMSESIKRVHYHHVVLSCALLPNHEVL